MYLSQHILARLSVIFSQLSMPVMLLDNTGQVILPESNNKSLTLPEQLLADPYTPYINGAFTLIGTNELEPMFLCLSGSSDEVVSCAKLCAQLVNLVLKDEKNTASVETGMRLILEGEVEASEVGALANELQIESDIERTVIYVHFDETRSESVIPIIRNLIAEESQDYAFEVGRYAVAIIKRIDPDFEEDQLDQYAAALQNTLLSEIGCNTIIGVGCIKGNLAQLHESLLEAKRAISIGRLFHPKQEMFNYKKMLLERFLSDIPEEMALSYYQTLFNRKTAKLFTEEMLTTIETFFDNSLNLSEAARKLYIHRNTLVYRLDKIQKTVGLDLRAFDDAVTFKLLMLMGKQRKDKKTRS